MAPRWNLHVSDPSRLKNIKNMPEIMNSEKNSLSRTLKKKKIEINLTTLRLFIFCVAFIHLMITAVVMLTIDMSQDEDPRIRNFEPLKWKLLTLWFNFIMLAYFPLCLYCDWQEHLGEAHLREVTLLRKIRDFVFTSILFPTTVFADVFFWRIYLKDPEYISPVALFSYMPSWGQHSLHTVSLIMIILDLLLTPRSKPKSVTSRWAVLTTFLVIYSAVVYASYVKGEMVYQMLGTFTGYQVILLCIMLYLEAMTCFFLQWPIIEYIWGRNRKKTAKQLE